MMRDLLFRDFGWKLFSLLLAAFIWYTVQKVIEEPKAAAVSPANISVTYGDVPVFIMATASNLTSYGINSNMVSVTVSGLPDEMDHLQKNQIHALIDLSDFDDRSKDLSRRVEVAVPWGVTVVKVEPALVKILPPKK